jgi:hypothetical protein
MQPAVGPTLLASSTQASVKSMSPTEPKRALDSFCTSEVRRPNKPKKSWFGYTRENCIKRGFSDDALWALFDSNLYESKENDTPLPILRMELRHPLIQPVLKDASAEVERMKVPLFENLDCSFSLVQDENIIFQGDMEDFFLYSPEKGLLNSFWTAALRIRSSIWQPTSASISSSMDGSPSLANSWTWIRCPQFVLYLVCFFFRRVFVGLTGTGIDAAARLHRDLTEIKKVRQADFGKTELVKDGLMKAQTVQIPCGGQDVFYEDYAMGCTHMAGIDAEEVDKDGNEFVHIDLAKIYSCHQNFSGSTDQGFFFVTNGVVANADKTETGEAVEGKLVFTGVVDFVALPSCRYRFYGSRTDFIFDSYYVALKNMFGHRFAGLAARILLSGRNDASDWLALSFLRWSIWFLDRLRIPNPYFQRGQKIKLKQGGELGGMISNEEKERVKKVNISSDTEHHVDSMFWPLGVFSYCNVPTLTWPKIFAVADAYYCDFVGPRELHCRKRTLEYTPAHGKSDGLDSASENQDLVESKRWVKNSKNFRDLDCASAAVRAQGTLAYDMPAYWPWLQPVSKHSDATIAKVGAVHEFNVSAVTLSFCGEHRWPMTCFLLPSFLSAKQISLADTPTRWRWAGGAFLLRLLFPHWGIELKGIRVTGKEIVVARIGNPLLHMYMQLDVSDMK